MITTEAMAAFTKEAVALVAPKPRTAIKGMKQPRAYSARINTGKAGANPFRGNWSKAPNPLAAAGGGLPPIKKTANAEMLLGGAVLVGLGTLLARTMMSIQNPNEGDVPKLPSQLLRGAQVAAMLTRPIPGI